MDFWPEFLATTWGREFLAGGVGGTAGVLAGYPLDTVRIRQQHSAEGSALAILRRVVAREGPFALYRGMVAPLASVTFQNAIAFQTYAVLSKSFDTSAGRNDPPSYRAVALGGIGTGAIQSLVLSPVELVKIRLQLQRNNNVNNTTHRGPYDVVQSVYRARGLRGIYSGLGVTVLRDAPAHGVYFWTYEYMREQLHPGCRRSGQETFRTMILAGGIAGVASWVCCYPLDVIKTRIQAQPHCCPARYCGMWDCFRRSVEREGYGVLWRGVGTAVARAFVVNGAVFTAYEMALRCIYGGRNDSDGAAIQTDNAL